MGSVDKGFALSITNQCHWAFGFKSTHIAHLWGQGPKKVLLWSQMHGNVSSTTRELLDLFDHLQSTSGAPLLERLTLLIIPQLNPDGSTAYTRLNTNNIDLNRDALDLSQPESIALNEVFESFSPDFCFNLHGQRSIFAAGKPATLSFCLQQTTIEVLPQRG